MRVCVCFALSFVVVATLASPAWSQAEQQAQAQAVAGSRARSEGSGEATASGKGGAATLRSGTKISAQLQSTVDAHTARRGDKVEARVTKSVKQDGRIVIHKGDRLVGQVTEVQASQTANAGSRLAITFDQLVSGESTSQLHTVLTSVFSTQSEGGAQQPMASEPIPMMAPAAGAGGQRGAGGGLLGGAGSTLRSATSVAGSAVGQVGGTVGAATKSNSEGSLVAPLRAVSLHAESQGNGQAQTSSVLSTRRGDLRLDSGTNAQFRVAGEAEAGGQAK